MDKPCDHHLGEEDILLAVFVIFTFVPSAVVPDVVAQLEARPVLGSVYLFLLLTCGGFALLSEFLSRRTSLLGAVGFSVLALITTYVGRRRNAASSPQPVGRGEPD